MSKRRIALEISADMFNFFSKEISRRQYEADELKKGIAAWKDFEQCMYNGDMASWRIALEDAGFDPVETDRTAMNAPTTFPPTQCQHMNFHAHVDVHRLVRTENGPVTGYAADLRIVCTECKLPFQFLGLKPGIDTQGAMVSIDGLEAHLAISPQGSLPSPLQRLAFGVEKFDG